MGEAGKEGESPPSPPSPPFDAANLGQLVGRFIMILKYQETKRNRCCLIPSFRPSKGMIPKLTPPDGQAAADGLHGHLSFGVDKKAPHQGGAGPNLLFNYNY